MRPAEFELWLDAQSEAIPHQARVWARKLATQAYQHMRLQQSLAIIEDGTPPLRGPQPSRYDPAIDALQALDRPGTAYDITGPCGISHHAANDLLSTMYQLGYVTRVQRGQYEVTRYGRQYRLRTTDVQEWVA